MGDQLPAGAASEDRHAKAEQQILEDAHVALHGLASDFALAGDFGQIQQAAVREADGLEKSREGPHVPDQRLGLHFLAQVEARVGAQGGVGLGGLPHQGDQTDRQCALQIEGGTEFSRDEGMHLGLREPPAEQVGRPSTQLARARSGEDEARRRRRLEPAMHDIEQRGNTLNLVDDDDASLRMGSQAFFEALRASKVGPLGGGLEQVDAQRVGPPGAQPGRLAGAAGAQQQEAPGWFSEDSPD